ncbi:hypothetical protein FDECE_12274 [Fusarium decemcellulare]|nr:hypothetical protein FDECE_12274 [Fusarium decemcellulare]
MQDDVAVARTQRIRRKPQRGLTTKTFLRAFTFWQLWAIAIAQEFGWIVKYSVTMLNYLPIIAQAVHLVSELLFAKALTCSIPNRPLRIRYHRTLCSGAFLPVATYPASEAPNWKIGTKVHMGFAVLSILMFIGIHFGFRREIKKKKLRNDENGRTIQSL